MKTKPIVSIIFFILAVLTTQAQQGHHDRASYVISNRTLTVEVLKKGAELYSLKTKTMEYIWQANPEFWSWQAPILFPIVGPLKDKTYRYKGVDYTLPQHGFARDHDFMVIKNDKTHLVLEQKATNETRKMYPFNYVLQVHYTLINKRLKIEYVVKNQSDDFMYFSIGAHPGFNCPFEKGQKRSDYQLVFDKKKSPMSKDKDGKFYIEKHTQVFDEPGVLELPDNRFDEGSLCFNPNPFSKTTFVYKPTGKRYLSIAYKHFPYLGIWSANNAPFVCIEPWHGIADNANHNKDFTKKEGIIKLEPNKTFKCSFTIEVY